MTNLLQQLQHAISTKNFELLYARLDYKETLDASKSEMIAKSKEMKKLKRITNDLIKYMRESNNQDALNAICDTINNMVLKLELVNDSLLMISAAIDQIKFEQVLIEATKYCLDSSNGKRGILWFKHCIQKSSILALVSKKFNAPPNFFNKKNQGKYLIFHAIIDQCVENHLMDQRIFIKNQVDKNWKELKNLVTLKVVGLPKPTPYLRQFNVRLDYQIDKNNDGSINGSNVIGSLKDSSIIGTFGRLIFTPKQFFRATAGSNSDDVMNNGVKPKYTNKELEKDCVSGFDASWDYDFNSYICNVLIVAAKVNPVFQQEAKRLLSPQYLGVACKYKDAPV